MSRKCINCGADLPEGTLFCTNCGTKIEDTAPAPEFTPSQPFVEEPVQPVPQPEPSPAPFVTPAPAPAPEPKTSTEAAFGVAPEAPGATYNQPPYQQPYYENPPYQQPPVQFEEPPVSKVVSTGGFFWLDLLYLIPGIGLLACIIIALAAKNLNIKHHACAKLVELLVLFVLLIILSILTVIAITQAGIDFNEIYKRITDIFYLPY